MILFLGVYFKNNSRSKGKSHHFISHTSISNDQYTNLQNYCTVHCTKSVHTHAADENPDGKKLRYSVKTHTRIWETYLLKKSNLGFLCIVYSMPIIYVYIAAAPLLRGWPDSLPACRGRGVPSLLRASFCARSGHPSNFPGALPGVLGLEGGGGYSGIGKETGSRGFCTISLRTRSIISTSRTALCVLVRVVT